MRELIIEQDRNRLNEICFQQIKLSRALKLAIKKQVLNEQLAGSNITTNDFIVKCIEACVLPLEE